MANSSPTRTIITTIIGIMVVVGIIMACHAPNEINLKVKVKETITEPDSSTYTGQTITEPDSSTYTGPRKERYKVAEVLREAAKNIDKNTVIFCDSKGKDSNGQKLVVIGSIRCSINQKNRKYDVTYHDGVLKELGCHSEETKRLAEQLIKEKSGILPTSNITINKKSGGIMFGLSLIQIIGIIIIAFIITKTAHYFTRKGTIRFAKKRFLNYIERRRKMKIIIKKAKKDLKKEWDETEV